MMGEVQIDQNHAGCPAIPGCLCGHSQAEHCLSLDRADRSRNQ